jgi:hypothetical protein
MYSKSWAEIEGRSRQFFGPSNVMLVKMLYMSFARVVESVFR